MYKPFLYRSQQNIKTFLYVVEESQYPGVVQNSRIFWMMSTAYADYGMLCFLYLIRSRYLGSRLMPVFPTCEDWHGEHYRYSLSCNMPQQTHFKSVL